MPPRFQKPYPPEFRREAVRLVRTTGRPYREVAAELGVSGESLRIWLRQNQLSRASMSAYGLGDYPEAMRLGRAGYEAFSEVNHRWGEISALCRMGFAAPALGDRTEAREHLSAALERAHAAQAISLELLALSGIGALLAEEGEGQKAAVLLTFALGHEQLPAAYGFAARPALDTLEASLSPEKLAAARLAAAAADLDELVAEALAGRVR